MSDHLLESREFTGAKFKEHAKIDPLAFPSFKPKLSLPESEEEDKRPKSIAPSPLSPLTALCFVSLSHPYQVLSRLRHALNLLKFWDPLVV